VIELPLVFMAGILGTAHCVGMCGPLALMIGGSTQPSFAALLRHVAYTAGRVFTYGTLGAIAGFGGQRLVHAWPGIVNFPALLAIAAGILLVYQGLLATGFFSSPSVGSSSAHCFNVDLLRHFLRRRDAGSAFIAGLFTGLLPCGLLYGMLALSISTHSSFWGGLTMICFGLGTAPAMMAIGIAGQFIGLAPRRWLLAAAAWSLVFTGVVSIARGVSFISVGDRPIGGCPMCPK